MIKLRAWDEKKKRYYRNIWGYGIECEINEDNELSLIIMDIDKVALIQDVRSLQPLLVSDVPDKNGQLICEGDILDGGKLFGKLEVIFCKGSFILNLESDDGHLPIQAGCCMPIIGNRFENPELLEGK